MMSTEAEYMISVTRLGKDKRRGSKVVTACD